MKKKIKKTLSGAVPKAKRLASRKKQPTEINTNGVPRITNDTIAEHRDEVLSSARKYIYPLQHSRHRIVTISIALFVAAVLIFFTYTLLALYRFHSTSTFIYRVTQVIPFPIAKAGPDFVAYENYLFEIRRYTHYYQTQQDIDFGSKSGEDQLADFRKRALDSVINDAYVKQLAKENNVTVTRAEINDQVELLRSQNRLGGSDQVFEDVLKEFWGWSVSDFERELKQQLLAQKVASALDTKTHDDAKKAMAALRGGADFAELAKQQSDDATTKANGGDYGIQIEQSNPDLRPQVVRALFATQPGQISDIIETPTGLEIVKVTENSNGKVKAAHIFFAFENVQTYIDQLKKEQKPSTYISP